MDTTNELNVTVTKKGRKAIFEGEPMTPAARQRRARSIAFKQLCDSNDLKEISTSHLIAFLPKLISDGNKNLVRAVCREIAGRA